MANANEQNNVPRELYLVNIVRFFSLAGGAHLTLHSVPWLWRRCRLWRIFPTIFVALPKGGGHRSFDTATQLLGHSWVKWRRGNGQDWSLSMAWRLSKSRLTGIYVWRGSYMKTSIPLSNSATATTTSWTNPCRLILSRKWSCCWASRALPSGIWMLRNIVGLVCTR